MENHIKPPTAKILPVESIHHGDNRVDNYAWMHDLKDPEMLGYLRKENEYTDCVARQFSGLKEKVYNEFISKIVEDDITVPFKRGNYFYFMKEEKGKNYQVHYRKKNSEDSEEQLILDINEIAGELAYCSVIYVPSPDGRTLAVGVDRKGDHSRTIYFRNLTTGETSKETLSNVGWSWEWAPDDKFLYYVKNERGNMGKQVFRHIMGQDQNNDELLYQEKDDRFWVDITISKSRDYIFLTSGCMNTSEVSYIDVNNPQGKFKLFNKRTEGLRYSVEQNGGKFYILTNYNAPNYRVMTTPVNNTSIENWKEFVPENPAAKIEEMIIFKDYLVLNERGEGLTKFRIINLSNNQAHYVKFPEPVYSAFSDANFEFDTKYFRYMYMSFITPRTIFDYDMEKGESILLKQKEVRGGYNKDNYMCERIYAKAHDGVMIPISLVYKKGLPHDGKNPAYLYSYGSYGISSEVWFTETRFSLLDRGFVYAIAHIRGGGEMGEEWYNNGKLLNKKNTFYDFISCVEHLVKTKYTYKKGITAMAASAGGLLLGAVANMRPDLFRCLVLRVPGTDVLNNLFDGTIENSAMHFNEWGNPVSEEYYYYIKSYSPYDNIIYQEYPHMLVTAGLYDVNVHCFEPAKYVAKLRAFKKDENELILKTEMEAAHFGPSGRYTFYKEAAFEYAFILNCFGYKE
ncbi:MAG: S9 family peptidase [Ignavibacteria bacterium]|jgi:oligopeptidase B